MWPNLAGLDLICSSRASTGRSGSGISPLTQPCQPGSPMERSRQLPRTRFVLVERRHDRRLSAPQTWSYYPNTGRCEGPSSRITRQLDDFASFTLRNFTENDLNSIRSWIIYWRRHSKQILLRNLTAAVSRSESNPMSCARRKRLRRNGLNSLRASPQDSFLARQYEWRLGHTARHEAPGLRFAVLKQHRQDHR